MFPHPGTRIAHPTNGCHPPSGRVLEASANEQAKKMAEGRALPNSSSDWRMRKEVGEGGGMGTGEKKGPAAGGKKQSELCCRSEETSRLRSRVWKEELKGSGEERAAEPTYPPRAPGGFWRPREDFCGLAQPFHPPVPPQLRSASPQSSSGAPAALLRPSFNSGRLLSDRWLDRVH